VSYIILILNFAETTVYDKVCKVLKKTSLVKGIKSMVVQEVPRTVQGTVYSISKDKL
jgi:hypothetical protein